MSDNGTKTKTKKNNSTHRSDGCRVASSVKIYIPEAGAGGIRNRTRNKCAHATAKRRQKHRREGGRRKGRSTRARGVATRGDALGGPRGTRSRAVRTQLPGGALPRSGVVLQSLVQGLRREVEVQVTVVGHDLEDALAQHLHL